VEPFHAEAPEVGDPVLLDLGGQTDPETGTDLAFRIWPAEDRRDPGFLELPSLSSAVPPLVVQDADLVRVLGRLRLESRPPATGGHG
jgi:hypothetical protein